MAVEIERKFLLKENAFPPFENGTLYVQGYLDENLERTIRVRIAGTKAFLTIKGKTTGCSKSEYEYKIPVKDAQELLLLCKNTPIRKTRYHIYYGAHRWDVDVFHEQNDGLILAEIELESENEPFDRPPWIGEEVTHDFKYYNAYLSGNPFRR